MASTNTTTGSSNSRPAPKVSVMSCEKYFEMSNSLTIVGEIWKLAKNWSESGERTRYPNVIPSAKKKVAKSAPNRTPFFSDGYSPGSMNFQIW